MVILDGIKISPMNKGSFLALRLASCAVILCTSFLHTFSFAQSTSEWQDVDINSNAPFDMLCEYRFKADTSDYSFGTSDRYWSYAGAVSATSITYVSHNQISHINADSKNAYRVDNSAPLYTVTHIQKRCDTWTDVSQTGADNFDINSEYRFKISGLAGGDAWYYASVVAPSNIVYVSHLSQTSHINANSKAMYKLDGVDYYSVSGLQKRVRTWSDVTLSSTTLFNPECEYRFES